jgi:ribosomal protein L37AE/L43A
MQIKLPPHLTPISVTASKKKERQKKKQQMSEQRMWKLKSCPLWVGTGNVWRLQKAVWQCEIKCNFLILHLLKIRITI